VPQVNVTIAGRTYLMACDDGQQDHLRALAARLDFKIAEMRVRFGEIGDNRITIMAALTIADEASEAEQRAKALTATIAAAGEAGNDSAAEADAFASSLEEAARRIEAVARSLSADRSSVAAEPPEGVSNR
jgi:cell division protein ZapA